MTGKSEQQMKADIRKHYEDFDDWERRYYLYWIRLQKGLPYGAEDLGEPDVKVAHYAIWRVLRHRHHRARNFRRWPEVASAIYSGDEVAA